MSKEQTELHMPSWEVHLRALEELDLQSVIDDPVALANGIIQRQHALDALKSFRVSAVPEEEREGVRARLQALLARDAETMQVLGEAREAIGAQLQQVVSGRALLRSYGGLNSGDTRSVKRTG